MYVCCVVVLVFKNIVNICGRLSGVELSGNICMYLRVSELVNERDISRFLMGLE